MTLLNPTTGADTQSRWRFRLGAAIWAALLAVQCIWLLLAQSARPGIEELPLDSAAATAAAEHRDAAMWTASVGGVRGDLWSEAAFTYANLLWSGNQATADAAAKDSVQSAHATLRHALRNAPHRSDAWLLLSALASRFTLPDVDPAELLKMSYYTGPSEPRLLPLRLNTAVRSDKLSDVELRQFVSRDLRWLLAQKKQASILADAFNNASVDGKNFILQTVGDIDPAAANALLPQQQKNQQLLVPH